MVNEKRKWTGWLGYPEGKGEPQDIYATHNVEGLMVHPAAGP
jgi:hypothetical protein